MHAQIRNPRTHLRTCINSQNSMGACHQTLLAQSILWTPLFVFTLGPPNRPCHHSSMDLFCGTVYWPRTIGCWWVTLALTSMSSSLKCYKEEDVVCWASLVKHLINANCITISCSWWHKDVFFEELDTLKRFETKICLLQQPSALLSNHSTFSGALKEWPLYLKLWGSINHTGFILWPWILGESLHAIKLNVIIT